MTSNQAQQGTTPKAPAAVEAVLKTWHRVECAIAIVCFIFIAVVLIIDVAFREFVGPVTAMLGLSKGSGGLFGVQTLAVFALVIGAFAGIGIATATASHLVPRVGFGWFPLSWSPVINRIADITTGIVLLITAWYGLQFSLSTKEFGVIAPIINTSPWMIQMAIPLGFCSAAIRYFIFAAWPSTRPQPPELSE